MASNFISSSSFSLPDEVLRKLGRSRFVTKSEVGPEATQAAIAGALDVGADLASQQARTASAFALEQERLEDSRNQFNLSLEHRNRELALDEAFRRSEQKRQEEIADANRKNALFRSIGEVGSTILFSPIPKGGTTIAQSIGKGVLKFFGF